MKLLKGSCKNIEDVDVLGVHSVQVGFVPKILYYFLIQYKIIYLAPLGPKYCWVLQFSKCEVLC
jgi:hypothetical protein